MEIYVKDILAGIELDTLLCAGTPYMINAGSSIDVEASCWRGYSWYPSFNRPIATQDSILELTFPPGDQSLVLVVTDINGCKDTTSLDVMVFSTAPDFAQDIDRICLPDEVSFTDLTTSDTTIVSWDWSFGDGASSTDQNPTHTYSPPFTTDSLMITLTTVDAVGCPTVATSFI